VAFPWHDTAWVAAGDFVEASRRPDEAVLAPDRFWWRFGTIHRFVRANFTVPAPTPWVVVHKGEMGSLPRPFVDGLLTTRRAVFANEVFVVFAERDDLPELDPSSAHLAAFLADARALPITPTTTPPAEADRILADEARIVQFSTLAPSEQRAEYERFFDRGGYRYPTARDQRYYDDVHDWLRRSTASWRGTRILEVCCAAVPFVDRDVTATVVRTDLAYGAAALARAADRAHPAAGHLVHATCDAEVLPFASATFGGVAFVDAIEHVPDPERAVAEASRVLEPNGELLLTFANRNSLNYVLNRALGHPEYSTNYQHLGEYTIDEVAGMLRRAGLEIIETGGIELRPYIGIPGVDEATRRAVDDDPAVVELLHELGHRVGVEYAYLGVVLARKPAAQ
jgi:SAM-dependent methyltransferase